MSHHFRFLHHVSVFAPFAFRRSHHRLFFCRLATFVSPPLNVLHETHLFSRFVHQCIVRVDAQRPLTMIGQRGQLSQNIAQTSLSSLKKLRGGDKMDSINHENTIEMMESTSASTPCASGICAKMRSASACGFSNIGGKF